MRTQKLNSIKPDSLEKTVLSKMDDYKVTNLNEEMSKALIALTLMSEDEVKAMEEDVAQEIWSYQALNKRLEFLFTVNLSTAVKIFIAFQCQGNIGSMLMYAYYLQYWAKKHNTPDIDINIFCKDIFPRGMWSEEKLQEFWELQKIEKGTNMIDIADAAMSIQFDIPNEK